MRSRFLLLDINYQAQKSRAHYLIVFVQVKPKDRLMVLSENDTTRSRYVQIIANFPHSQSITEYITNGTTKKIVAFFLLER